MRVSTMLLCVALCSVSACSTEPAPSATADASIPDAAPSPTPPTPGPTPTPVPPPPYDPDIDDCDRATSCPAVMPAERAPCSGTFTCTYGSRQLRCNGEEIDDVAASFDAGGIPYLAESCPLPFEGTMTGARIELLPGFGDARAFEPGERVAPQVGPQGGTMLYFRVRVVGDDVPDCVQMNATVALDGGEPAPAIVAVRLHCGQSYRLVAILADNPCAAGDHAVSLTVELEGIGTTTVDLVMEPVTDPRACIPAG
ncbi:MAG: hypothetical protein IT379_37410 [Deltaproteobacteria bacterium]|nr:hypothetical protein [Deltaproteobacteria bacterium]